MNKAFVFFVLFVVKSFAFLFTLWLRLCCPVFCFVFVVNYFIE